MTCIDKRRILGGLYLTKLQINQLLKQKKKIDLRLDKLLCKQCGECCHEIDYTTTPPTRLKTYCEQLEWIGEKAYCKLYPNHHGYSLNCGGMCVPVNLVFYRHKNCPYNEIYPREEI